MNAPRIDIETTVRRDRRSGVIEICREQTCAATIVANVFDRILSERFCYCLIDASRWTIVAF